MACSAGTTRGNDLPNGGRFAGRLTDSSPRWRGAGAGLYKFKGKRETRLVAEASSTAGFVPMMGIELDGKLIASSTRPGGGSRSWLDVLLPEDAEYTLAVHSKGMKNGDFTVQLRRDRDLPTSRAGDFVLAHADKGHVWLVDATTLQRTGDIAKFMHTELLSSSYQYKGKRLHSVKLASEVNCRDKTFRATRATVRVIGDDGRHQLADDAPAADLQAWHALGHREHLLPIVCDGSFSAHLRWPDLDMVVDAYKAVLRRREAEEKEKATREALSAALEPVAIGQTVHGTLPRRQRRYPTNWAFKGYKFTVRPGDRFEVDVQAAFRPYLRLRAGDEYLVSTVDAMYGGAAGPIGDELEATEEVEVVIELSAFEDPLGGKYELTVRRLPGK